MIIGEVSAEAETSLLPTFQARTADYSPQAPDSTSRAPEKHPLGFQTRASAQRERGGSGSATAELNNEGQKSKKIEKIFCVAQAMHKKQKYIRPWWLRSKNTST